MKKLVTSGWGASIGWLCSILVALFLLLSKSTYGQGCIMTCLPMDPPVEIPLPSSCEDELTYGDLGVVLVNCPGEITVNILDGNGGSLGNAIDASMIGNTYMVIISHPESGQSCMGMMTVADKQAPVVNCPDDVTLDCTTDLDAYTALFPEDVDDCSPYNIYIDDQLVFSGQCQGNIISQYLRTYTIIDAYANVAACEQTISLAKANLGDVVFPPNLTGPDALACAPHPDISPDETGYPSVEGNEILVGNFCNLNAGYTDQQVPICSGSYKILRTWTVMDWCDASMSTAVQIIEVLDMTDPIVVAPADLTVSTNATSCTADVLLGPATISEDCSTLQSVWTNTPYGHLDTNGGLITGLPVGTHQVIYTAISDCGLQGKDTLYITVVDLQPPVPVCHGQLTIPLNNEGTAIIPAHIFNAASHDNCGDVYFKVKRMGDTNGYTCTNPGNPENNFDDYVQFCCGDIANNPIMVIMRVFDVPPVAGPVEDDYLAGHFNDCMIQVEIQDKLPPQIVCPDDLTISCQFPYTLENLDVFGTVVTNEADRQQICIDDPGVPGHPGLQCIGLDGLATDNCEVSVSSTATQDINMCGIGTITRTFTATDDGGLTATCVQVISVINYDPFDESDISWPPDYTTTNTCEIDLLDPEDLFPPYNEPVLQDGPCDLAGATYHDEVYDFSNHDQACFKILRTWKVIDWCQFNQNYGVWEHIQVIKVMNNVAPEIEPIADRTECSFDPQCGGLELNFEANAEDDCSSAASLTWKYYIDLDNNASFDFESGQLTGGSVSFTRYMPLGTHRILYSVWDMCGNSSTEEQLVTVESCKPPSAKCIHGLSANLMPMDTDGDGQADWGMVVIQAEMFDAGSSHPCGTPISLAFSADPLDVTHVYDCGDLGDNEVELWAIDQNGLTDFCITTIEIQDNNGICPPDVGGTGIISGNITVPNSGKLAGAMVYLDGSGGGGIPTNADGYFVFPSMPFGGQYVVRPEKSGDYRNGVTTLDLVRIQKHLLGIQYFDSPYQYIAADANNSQSITAVDILQLRKLILGVYDELPSNKSWRFVDEAHIFPDVNNPWASGWDETYPISAFNNNMNGINFKAIKIGDINQTASLHASGAMILPRNGTPCQVSYEVSQQPEEDMLRIDVYAEDASKYMALQFSFGWDSKSYTLVDWKGSEWVGNEDIRLPDADDPSGSLAITTTSAWPVERMPLFTLWTKAEKNAYPFQLFLKQGPTTAAAYQASTEEEVNVQLVSRSGPVTQLKNQPNPFRDMTSILMTSDREEKAVLRVYDMDGRKVQERNVQLEKGSNEFIVHRSELKGQGVYFYEIESEFQYSTNRMIIVD